MSDMKDYMYYTDDNGVECQEEIIFYTFTNKDPAEVRFLTPSGIYMYKASYITHEELETLPKPAIISKCNSFYRYTGDCRIENYMSWLKPYKEISAKWENVYNIDRICLSVI
jgi:hypothetical protein